LRRLRRTDPQELFDGWRAALEQRLRAEDEHPVLLSHLAKYRSLMPSLALILHLIDGDDRGVGGPVSRVAAERAGAWCQHLETPLGAPSAFSGSYFRLSARR
jgi:hypothetical protein